jgi:hypothetical protein
MIFISRYDFRLLKTSLPIHITMVNEGISYFVANYKLTLVIWGEHAVIDAMFWIVSGPYAAITDPQQKTPLIIKGF